MDGFVRVHFYFLVEVLLYIYEPYEHMGPERGRSTTDRGCELEAGSSGLYVLSGTSARDTACMSPTGRRGSQGHRAG